MVADQTARRLLTEIRAGLESLTVAGSPTVLNSLYQEALHQVARRPSQQEREMAISQAWLASSRALQLLRAGNPSAAAQAVDEMYRQARAAISASRPALR
jgi:hypothetical protein